MLLINPKHSKTLAFKHGFLKGLGAPFLIFGNFSAPKAVAIEPVVVPEATGNGTDWLMVGRDIKVATQQYGEKTKAAK